MRDGLWPDTSVRETAAQVRVNGVIQDVDRVTVTAEMASELAELGGSATPVADGQVDWPQRSTVASTASQPFVRAGDWPPAPTTPATVEVGDGAGQWFRRFTGRIESSSGRITDAGTQSRLVDLVDQLSQPISHGALLAQMPPSVEGSVYLYPGLLGTYVTDLCARASGFNATASLTSRTLLSAPMQGSLWPEVGTLVRAGSYQNLGSVAPAWLISPWGVAPYNVNAEWSTTIPRTGVVITVSMLAPFPGGLSTISWVDDAGVGAFLSQTDTDDIWIGTLLPNATTLASVPRLGATRASLYANRSAAGQIELTLHLSDGRIVTQLATDPAFTGPASRVQMLGPGALGGLLVEEPTDPARLWDAVQETPTAVLRVSHLQYLQAMPSLDGNRAVDLITAQATAEGASWWIDADGIFRWAGRDVLRSDPVVATKSTRLGVDDLSWSDDLASIRQTVTMRRRQPAISRYTASVVPLAEISSQTLSNGQTVEQWLDPGSDEDWIYPATSLTYLGSGTVGSLSAGSYCGAVVTADSASDGVDVWASPVTQIEVTLQQVGLTYKLTQTARGLPAGLVAVTKILDTATNIARWMRGVTLPIFRGRGRVRWTDQADTYPTGAADTIVNYDHPCGWWLQDDDERADVRRWLIFLLGTASPSLDQVVIDPDPRLQLGDKIRVQDPDRTGLEIDLFITRIDETWQGDGAPTMTVSGRVTRIAQPTVPTDPTSSWELLLAGWREEIAP